MDDRDEMDIKSDTLGQTPIRSQKLQVNCDTATPSTLVFPMSVQW